MTSKPRIARRSLAEAAANNVLHQMKITGLKVDPIAIAESKGIVVKAKPDTAAGASGMLMKAGDEFGIMYATNIASLGFQRFSISHELGHYFIEGHCDALLSSGFHLSQAGFVSPDPFEQEADCFAAALLMPERSFKREIENHPAGLQCIEALANACETSLTATAIRYCSLTQDGVAVLRTSGSTVDWCYLSNALKETKEFTWIRPGTSIPSGTATAAFNASAENIRSARRHTNEVLLNDWLGGATSYPAVEEVVGLGQYGKTLTILTCRKLTQREDVLEEMEEEQALIESWTPKFRR